MSLTAHGPSTEAHPGQMWERPSEQGDTARLLFENLCTGQAQLVPWNEQHKVETFGHEHTRQVALKCFEM